MTEIVTLLTVIAGFVFQIYLAERKRQWDIEDRRAYREELANKVETAAASVATRLSEDNRKISKAIAENTQINVEALTEANRVNLKLHQLGLANNKLLIEQKRDK